MHRSGTPGVFVSNALFFYALIALIAAMPGSVFAQAQVKDHNEINSVWGLPGLPISLEDYFGVAATSLDDLDGDGVKELAVGETDGIWIIFPNSSGLVKSYVRINATEGGITGPIDPGDAFGMAVEAIGDLDGDGIVDLAVGSYADDDGGTSRGAVWILFMYADGTVKANQKISSTAGGFTGTLDNDDLFGSSLGALGDLDGDGVEDLAVGAYGDDDGGSGRGALWILFLNTDGTVKASQKISDYSGGFTGTLDNSDSFGVSVTSIGDLDGDTIIDIAVGASGDDDYYGGSGAVWILFLNTDGTVKAHQKISATEGNLPTLLYSNHYFGQDLASPGDLDGDGVGDLMVGGPLSDAYPYSYYQGSVYMLLLNSDGTVKSCTKINDSSAGFVGTQNAYGYFGYGITAAGDVDGDGVVDMAVGAYRDGDCGANVGALYILFMNGDGTLKTSQKINCTMGGLVGMMFDYEHFGASAAGIGDIDGNGVCDIAVGATDDRERAGVEGALWILMLDTLGQVEDYSKISAATGWPGSDLGAITKFGCAVDSVGDLDGDGYTDLAVGAMWDDDGATNAGAVYILMLDSAHTVKSHVKISATSGGFTGVLSSSHNFGAAVAGLGDLDGDGVEDVAVGASGDEYQRGAVWVLMLNSDGTVKSQQKIAGSTGGFTVTLDQNDLFGCAVANLGDLDGDGVTDLAVGGAGDDDGGDGRGALWLLLLNTDGTVKSHQKISDLEGGFPAGELDDNDELGASLAAVGDIDGNGIPDLAVGVPGDDEGGTDNGAFWLLFLESDGTVSSHAKIGDYSGNFYGILYPQEKFGSALASLGDINGDGWRDIAVGAPLDDNYDYSYHERGSLWTLRLEQEPAECTVSPEDIEFGVVDLGSYVDTTFTIVNTGGTSLSGTISESCDHFSIISGEGAYSIGPDAVHEVTVRYEPSAGGIHDCLVETGDGACSDVYLTGVTSMTVSIATEPVDLAISVDGSPLQAPYQFVTGAGFNHLIGTDSLQVVGDTTYVFTGWSDGGTAAHLFTAGAEDTVLTATFDLFTSWARIDSIVDVPDDQGGWLRIFFRRSVHDAVSEAVHPITGYNVYRRVEEEALLAKILSSGEKLSDEDVTGLSRNEEGGLLFEPAEGTEVIGYGGRIFTRATSAAAPPGLWEVVTSLYATQKQQYIQLVPTRADSASTIPWEAFYISAHTTTPAVYFDSPPDSGYSVDNIAPGVPQGLAVTYNTGSGNQISWDPSPEPDFQYYCVYRGDTEGFVPGPGTLVHETAAPGWTDPAYDGWDVHYKVTALDHTGNESEAASPATVTGDETPLVPKAFALHQNVPNPFNPSTVIRFDLPRPSRVTLAIYSVKGELVATLVDGRMTEGRKELSWTGRDDGGRSVASGVYFYRLTVGDFVRTRKMVLLR